MLSVSAVRQNLTLLSLKDENLFFLFTFAIACLPISADMLQAVVVTSPKPTFNFKLYETSVTMLHCRIAAHAFTTDGRQCQEKNQDIGHNHGYAHRRHGPQRRRVARPEVGADSLRRPFQERRHFAHVNLLGRRVWREQR